VRVSECFGSKILLSHCDGSNNFLLDFARKYIQCNACLIPDRFLGYLWDAVSIADIV
jgi:hypothetical protein